MTDRWQAQAACKDKPTEWFFGAPDDHGTRNKAMDVCFHCPVLDECLDFALRTFATGIWGGTSERERDRIRRRRLAERERDHRPRLGRAQCGTDSGYYRHRRNGEAACDPCKAAHVDVTAARVIRSRLRAEGAA